ncbi:hypothetical protein CAPTEDRAFT_181174 [Capitella teleta]|uniref:Sm domain-containing protein n=1 Tax=Capitella teleta TaxID=283909 RepID=R7UGE7_CAPTE|nr:hypothetical protein CAPTEDRAFT_181174 [Capitella teleta]|eukprot:ELU05300.1 hypothetical protein CAPTEDRAFT_181174 [Capitella teleta]
MSKVAGKEKAVSLNTLLCLLQGCVGRCTTIELRNDDSILGTIDHVDIQMNVFLSTITFTRAKTGQQSQLDKLYVQGKNIRYVHIPDDMDMMACIEGQVSLAKTIRDHKDKRKPKARSRAQCRKDVDAKVAAIRSKLEAKVNLME